MSQSATLNMTPKLGLGLVSPTPRPPFCQGTAADIVKTAMVLVARRLDAWRSSLEEGLDCPRLIMQVRPLTRKTESGRHPTL